MNEAKSDESELTALLGERYARAMLLRRKELTYKQIGNELGVGVERARQMVGHAERVLAKPKAAFDGLSERAKNALRGAGYETKEQVLDAVKNGVLHPCATFANRVPNYGKKSHREVCEWLGLDIKHEEQKSNEKTIARYIAYIERNGYRVTRAEDD